MKEEFVVTKEHIKLLQSAVVRWEDCEFGAPSIDCKRPYGNSSVYQDIAEVLGIPYGSLNKDWAYQLHKETEIALQIFLNFGRMIPGRYVRKDWGNWNIVAEYI